MKKAMVTILLLALGSSCFASGQRDTGRSCDSMIPFTIPVDPRVAQVSELRLIAKIPSTSGDFSFTNRSAKEVVSVLAVVELRDREREYMFNMLFHAFDFKGYHRDRASSSPERQAEQAIQFDRPLMPGETKMWSMESPFFVTECPASARASFLQIQFSDGSIIERSDTHAHREPLIMDAATIDLTSAPFSLPFEVLTTLEIDSNGRPYIKDVGSASDDFKQWLATRVQEWEFAPAYSGTTAVSGTLNVLFRFHEGIPKQYPTIETLPRVRVFEVADVFPHSGRQTSWVYFGLSPVSMRGISDK